MDVSVIIAASRADVERCIKSLETQVGNINYEVIVIGEKGMERPTGEIVWAVSDTTNPAVKRNIGARLATGKYLVFMDDDAEAPPGWLETICNIFNNIKNIAGVGGPNLPPEGASEAERMTDAILSTKIGSGTLSYSTCGEDHNADVGEIHLVNFAVRRDFFMKMGGFNEALGYGAEDSEFIYLAKRLQLARFLYSPRVWVWHRRREYGGGLFRQRFKLRMQNGRLLWVRPGMYMRHRTFAAATVGLWFFPLFLANQTLLIILAATYFLLLYLSIRNVKNIPKWKWMPATAAVHVVSILGLLAGFLRVPGRAEYSKLMRRQG